jgi:response regulator NasT
MTHILIVEDDRLVLAGLAGDLEGRGYRITCAATGEEAVSLAVSLRPQLVLIDICLPGISGMEAARRIRDQLDVPVIFLSALDGEDVVREAITTGSLSYLVKPIGIRQLVPAIENALARACDIARMRESEEQLATALRQDRDVSVAIGKLMERHGATAEDAFEMLRDCARNTRRKAGDVAKDVISGALLLEPPRRPGRKPR